MTTNLKNRVTRSRLWAVFCLFFIMLAAVVVLTRITIAVAIDRSDRAEARCDPVLFLLEFFDGVTPPALPTGWSSTTWVTSNSGVPTPPADTLPNAAFVDDPATISDKQLLSPNITSPCDVGAVRVSFRNNFNLQDGFDGGGARGQL
jgi:hypothetical protein